tara:strand:- start:1183 stop:1833 length:651 start_codon:yes stop_codon:yes gene_type:complete
MISVLIPIYNGIEFIDESVKSVINQSYEHWEIIIGINGHSENSNVYKKALEYKSDKIKIYDLFNIKGKSNALNDMINYCSYDWIALLDVDDIWLPDKLLKQISFIKKYDVIGTHCKYFGELNCLPNIPLGDISKFDFLKTNPIINSSCIIKKNLAIWDSNNELEDYDLWLKLRKQNKKFYNVPEILVFHRIHKKSYFNNTNYLKVNDLKKKYINNI